MYPFDQASRMREMRLAKYCHFPEEHYSSSNQLCLNEVHRKFSMYCYFHTKACCSTWLRVLQVKLVPASPLLAVRSELFSPRWDFSWFSCYFRQPAYLGEDTVTRSLFSRASRLNHKRPQVPELGHHAEFLRAFHLITTVKGS